jgi:thiol:disulfide interchange protein
MWNLWPATMSNAFPPDQIDFELTVPAFVKQDITPVAEVAVAMSVAEIPTELDAVVSEPVAETLPSVPAEAEKTLWGIFWLSFLGGLAALLTPCVFPMIPLTVSFFLRNAENRLKALRDGFVYGITIIVAYVVFGLAIAFFFGADALNNLATSYIFNVIFFALLVFFAASFFGAFELTMPSKWSNALDSKADSAGGVIGVILMGFTFVLVSFSCTGPIVGTLLVEAATGGNLFSPAIGMFGFSLAMAIPFTLFAIFPTAMKSLPKSGGWMNSVKVVLGFVVLAFSLKFLSVADAVGEWGILDREVFLVLWIAIFLLMGLYLIGKIKFSHDSDLPYMSVPRTLLAIVTFAFVFYLIPGLWGAPLKAVSSFLPSTVTQDFDLTLSNNTPATAIPGGNVVTGKSVKQGPYGLMVFTDYEEGLEAARKSGKPVFLDFTGKGCANCKKMENMVWSDAAVRGMLANDFVIVSLYVDNREMLPDDQQYVSEVTGKKIRTVGNKWSDFQITHYQSNSQPLYVLMDGSGKPLNAPRAYNTDVNAYTAWMQAGLKAFKVE